MIKVKHVLPVLGGFLILGAVLKMNATTHEAPTRAPADIEGGSPPPTGVSPSAPNPDEKIPQAVAMTSPTAQGQEVKTLDAANLILSSVQLESLLKFSKIKMKVFLNDEEKSFRKSLYQNDELLNKLKEVVLASETQQRQIALDLLLEASLNSNSPAATAALLAIVQDKQIEDDQRSITQRQPLAEAKADLLYQWTSKQPEVIPQIEAVIPGSVTEKIWANVKQAQEQNRIESLEVR